MSEFTVEDGQVVSMEYSLRVAGELLDTSEVNGPLQFLVGHSNIIPGLERQMLGMKIGESKEVVVAPAEGYGEFDEEAFLDVERNELPPEMPVEEGVELHVTDDEGQSRYARIDTVNDKQVRLNFNHPLAGMELHFNVKVVGLREPTPEEVEHGHVHGNGHNH